MFRSVFAGVVASVAAYRVQHNDDKAEALQQSQGESLIVGTEVNTSFYNEPPTTLKGCTCRDPCEAGVHFSCYSQMYCTVESQDCPGGQAEWSLTQGYYDYCLFPRYQPYEDLSAVEKKGLLLDAIYSDTTMGHYPFVPRVFTGMFTESMWNTFEGSDVMPVQRKKYIHSVGWTGPVRFESNGGHEYTGLFQGAEHGIIRFSAATQFGLTGKITPGFGLKLLRDGQPSGNLVAMPSLDGQPCSEENLFSRNYTTKIPFPSGLAVLIGRKFMQVSHCPLTVGLSNMAEEQGVSPIFPHYLIFRPPVGLNVSIACDMNILGQTEFGPMASLTPGTVLFEVLAAPFPGGDLTAIGRVVLEGRITSSRFGDEQLAFRHQRKEEDWALRPEWLEGTDMVEECGAAIANAIPPTHDDGCSSPWKVGGSGMLEEDTTPEQ